MELRVIKGKTRISVVNKEESGGFSLCMYEDDDCLVNGIFTKEIYKLYSVALLFAHLYIK